MFVDIFSKCLELFDKYNWKYDPYGFIVDDGGVYLTASGAREIAKLIVKEIKQSADSDMAALKSLINPKAKLDMRAAGGVTGY